jgi:two-component system nitrogen regulation sensor histidine kinase NtrY
MRKRFVLIPALVLLAILVTLIVWQQSFHFGEYGPDNSEQTFVFWAVSTLIFLLTVTIGFMLFRTFVKLYLERQQNREGTRIQTKLVLGALALSLLPVVFLVAFSYDILNRNVEKWFMQPVQGIRVELDSTTQAYADEVAGRAQALANWLAALPEVRDGKADFPALCAEHRITELRLDDITGAGHTLCAGPAEGGVVHTARAPVAGFGTLVVRVEPHTDVVATQGRINDFVREYNRLNAEKRSIRTTYLLFIALIAAFILFVATWIALILARQISGPIASLLAAAEQVRKGNLAHRVTTPAIDEMASLVRAFNTMTQGLEENSRELESRRRFTEAILESIPSGVLSLTADGRIQRVNRALRALIPAGELERATCIGDLLPPEHAGEIRYLMKRARRTGVAGSQMEIERPEGVLHLSVTVSALPALEAGEPGYVVVVEDTSDLLRAQKAAAWHEVARRIAHELKNPLTPIALSAERIARVLDRGAGAPESHAVLRQCAATISREVESVKALADEFSRFSRFPAARPVACNLNDVVRHGLEVFDGRLDGIQVQTDLAPDLPCVYLDPEQFQRVVVNLVDNAAEAMRDSMVKRLLIATRAAEDCVELLVADTGRGVSPEDKEKLFLPYFSTKGRGTGLGLAIVSQIVAEHNARIRVEDNRPAGARFYVEIPVAVPEPAPESATAAGVRS